MTFPYKTVLVIGATSGIGLALAEKLVESGSYVIAVGRRQENLDRFVEKHGRDKASAVKFDITDLEGIPAFAEKITKAHPNLDSIILNSGIQRSLDFSKPASINLPLVSTELTTNYLSHIHLVTHFLPHLQSLSTSTSTPTPTSLIFITSGLALIPLPRCANYCASKAALHHLIMSMRHQLKGGNVKVVEVLPPAVQTELHDEKHQPDIKDGGNIGMPLEEFMEEAWRGLCVGDEEVPVGMAKGPFAEGGFEMGRKRAFQGLLKNLEGRK